MTEWAVAICSVLFDLDVGQRIDSMYPEDALTEEEANDVAFHSFPVPPPLPHPTQSRPHQHSPPAARI